MMLNYRSCGFFATWGDQIEFLGLGFFLGALLSIVMSDSSTERRLPQFLLSSMWGLLTVKAMLRSGVAVGNGNLGDDVLLFAICLAIVVSIDKHFI